MGLYDRDYMRERHRQTLRREYRDVPTGRGGRLPWRNALLTIALLALGALLAAWWSERKAAHPFPETGAVYWYSGTAVAPGAPLTIAAPHHERRNYAVRLGDWSTDKIIAIIPVRAGETVDLEIPFGQYSVTIASGERWHGPEKLFGWFGERRKATSAFHFYRAGSQNVGHRIDLAQRLNGNLETRPLTPFER